MCCAYWTNVLLIILFLHIMVKGIEFLQIIYSDRSECILKDGLCLNLPNGH